MYIGLQIVITVVERKEENISISKHQNQTDRPALSLRDLISGDFCFPSTVQLLSNPYAKALIFARNKAHPFIQIPLRIYLSMFSRNSFKMLSLKQDKLK